MVGTMNSMAVNPHLLKRLQDRAEQENVPVETLLERWLDLDAVCTQADLLQQVSDAIITTDRDLMITTWNSGAERIYGWKEAEALGRKIDDLLKTEWMVEPQAQAQKMLLETGLWRGEIEQRARDGQARYIWAAVSWLKDDQGAITGGITVNRDITGQKRAEVALQEGEAILRALIEQSRDSIRIVDDQQRILYWNAASEELTGIKREDALGKPFFDVTKSLVPDDRKSPETYRRYQERLSQVSQAVQNNETILGEYQLQRPDGTIRTVETTVFPVLAGGRVYVCGINRDITEKKQAERNLEESRRQLATLLNNLPGMAYRCLNNPEWTMVFVSSGCTALTGYAPADLLDNRRISYGAIIHPDDRAYVWQAVGAAQAERQPFEIEYRIITADGTEKYVWERGVGVFENGQMAFIEGFISDITRRKRAEEALRESEEKYRLIAENTSDGILILDADAATTKVAYASPAYDRQFGREEGKTTGLEAKDIYELIHPEDRDATFERIYSAIGQQADTLTYTFRARHEDGHYVWREDHAKFRYDRNGRHINTYVVSRDITERKQAEDALRRQNDYLTVLHQVTLDLLNRRNSADLLHSMVNHAARIMDAPYAEIIFVEGDDLVVQTCTDNQPFVAGDRAGKGEATLTWQAYDTCQVVMVEDYSTFPAHRAIYDSLTLRAVACFPIMAGPRCLGVLDLSRDIPGQPFTPDEIQQGILFSQLIALMLDNTHLYEAAERELTQRRQTERALRASEARLRSLIETQTAYVIRTDLNGSYTYVNEAFFKRFCWKHARVDELIGTFSLLSIVPEDHQKTQEAVNACIQQPGLPVQVILRKPTQDGGVYWTLWEFIALQNGGAVYEIQCMGIDITELMQARQQLQLQEQALQSAANAIVITDQDGLIRWANPAFTTLTGYTFEEAQGIKTNLLKSGVQDAAFYEALWHTILSGQVWQGRMVNRRKDGGLYIEEQTITPVRDGSGTITHFVAIKQDITEREQAEQMRLEQERLKLNLKKEQELNALVQKAVSALSHDIRTPLAAIGTAKDMLNLYFDRINEEQRREKLESIDRQLRYVLELLDDMMLVVTGSLNHGVFKPAPVNLPALCQASIGEIQTAAGSGHRFLFVTDGRIKTVKVDETLVSRILLNLLSNAVKFSPETSEIRLELNRQDDWIMLRVIDEGIGIAEADQPRIFEPFYRAEAVRGVGGTGLGLNIVKDCVARHQGQVSVESRLDAGAIFTVKLPLLV